MSLEPENPEVPYPPGFRTAYRRSRRVRLKDNSAAKGNDI
jgi:hypothetical protein